MAASLSSIIFIAFALASHCSGICAKVNEEIRPNNAGGVGVIRLCCEIGNTFYPQNSCHPVSTTGLTRTMHHTFYHQVCCEDGVAATKSHLLRDFDSVSGVPGCTDLIMIPLTESWDLFRVRWSISAEIW